VVRINTRYQFSFYNRGILWDIKGDLERAIADQTEAIRLDPKFAEAYAQRGYALFSKLDFSGAAADLLKATQLADDARAMLLRHVARARAGENATTELEANSARLKTKQWPYLIIEMFLGRRSPEATLRAATPSERCVAEFFISEWHLMRGDPQTARSKWRITVDACPPTSLEYRTAKAELRVLDSR
jgi:lipoprotein NlpI